MFIPNVSLAIEKGMELIRKMNLLGVRVGAINMEQALTAIDSWITNGDQQFVCVTPAHGIMDCYYDTELRNVFNQSGMITPDGMSIVWLLRWKGFRHVSRVYGPDLLLAACEKSGFTGWRHFFYGGEPGVVESLTDSLLKRFPALNIVGSFSPPFRELTADENRDVVNHINDAKPHIVWVGISTPKQERWMFNNLGKLNAPVLIGIGAAFDFISGRKRQAPRWMQRSGLEWLFRLATEPRRLWRRYSQYPHFLWLVLLQELGFLRITPEQQP